MKKIILSLVLTLTAALPLTAQKGLHIEELFGGKYQHHKDATEVLLKGRQISQYGLTLFRSLTVSGTGKDGQYIEQLVRNDTRLAADKETGLKAGRLYYGFYRLPPLSKKPINRYLFYRNNPLGKGGKPTLTLIYMEGTASIEDLRKTFAK